MSVVIMGMLIAVLHRCQWNLAYTLDDPYIHLAMSEQIARGEYGINPGESVAASSSVIWPFLLAPFATLGTHHWVSFVINALSVIAAANALRRTLSALGFDRSAGGTAFASAVTVLICVQLGPVTTVFTGMEHGLQVLCMVGMLSGLVRVAAGAEAPWWCVLAIASGPLIRYELAPATVAATVALIRLGKTRPALLAGTLAGAGLAGFSVWLASMNLPLLPASVLTKSNAADATLSGGISRLLDHVEFNLFGPAIRSPAGMTMCLFLTAVGIRLLVTRSAGSGWPGALVAGTAVIVHLLVGGWLDDRYVLYAVLFCVIGALWIWADPLQRLLAGTTPLRSTMAACLLISCIGATTTTVLAWIPMSASNVWEQHGQIHRFLVEQWRRPVAVVDVGWASYRNEQFVLDLHGLASDRLRRAKASGRFPEEVAAALRDGQISLYVGYEFGRPALPRDWVLVGVIHLAGTRSSVAGDSMSFVTARSSADDVRSLLRGFRATLPPGVRLDVQ